MSKKISKHVAKKGARHARIARAKQITSKLSSSLSERAIAIRRGEYVQSPLSVRHKRTD